MIPFELKQIAGKAAGTYFVVSDNSEGSQNEIFTNLRVAPISSEKGNTNQLIIFKQGDIAAFESMFGKKNRRQEKRGNFSHSACIEMLKQGDLGVVNLREYDDNLDNVGIAGMNSDSTESTSKVVPYSSLFDNDGFWNVKKNNIIIATGSTNLLNFANIGNEDLSFFVVFDSNNVENVTNEGNETLASMEIEVEEYPGLDPEMRLKDTFVTVSVFKNSFKNALANEFYGDLFKQVDVDGTIQTVLADGLNSLTELKKLQSAGFVTEFNGSLLPHLKSEFGSDLSIDTIVTAGSNATGLTCAINAEVFETEFSEGYNVIDTYNTNLTLGAKNLSVVNEEVAKTLKLVVSSDEYTPTPQDLVVNSIMAKVIDNGEFSTMTELTLMNAGDKNYVNVPEHYVGLFKNENLVRLYNQENLTLKNVRTTLVKNPSKVVTLNTSGNVTGLTVGVDGQSLTVDVDSYMELIKSLVAPTLNVESLPTPISKINLVNFAYENRSNINVNFVVRDSVDKNNSINVGTMELFPSSISDFLDANATKIKFGNSQLLSLEFDAILSTAVNDVKFTLPIVDTVSVNATAFNLDIFLTSPFISTTLIRWTYESEPESIGFAGVKGSGDAYDLSADWPVTPVKTAEAGSYKLILADRPLMSYVDNSVQSYVDSYKLTINKPLSVAHVNLGLTELKSIKLREAQLINGSADRQSRILDVMNTPAIVNGFKNFTGIRYFVDVFKSHVEADYKIQFNRLVDALDSCNIFTRALVNEPFVTDLRASTNPTFRSVTGEFDLNYLATGGNEDLSTIFINKPKLSAEKVYYFGSGHLDNTDNLQIITPNVSSLFINKNKPWDIVANTSGELSGIVALESYPDDTERKTLENFGWNPIIKKRRNFVVYGDYTGHNAFKKRKALSFVSNSELLMYIKSELYLMSLDENFKKGTYDEYIKFETTVKNFMDGLALQGAIKPNPTVVCNFTNNTDDIANAGIKLVTIEYFNLRTLDKVVFALDLK